jgi:hypothetical protein
LGVPLKSLGSQHDVSPELQFVFDNRNNPKIFKRLEEKYMHDSRYLATVSEEGFFGMSFVDSFHLLKKEGGWVITSKVFNRD